ncbi:hypothetical protein cce_4960 [Crocosphaera subtropica ATCC 51142]|uniref:Uncharacterized protein n=1 Tax=Crocosphaera subtropica (strain ATCC 51142 / BH68) TaxID=43989 RepID=B1X2E5_CROS5|nr:hypothetical protein [Crocosphaera subtropica]ACB54306.1 hypothetical protein cce_4960 [Crocosphaera subtropica ATCC 51142]
MFNWKTKLHNLRQDLNLLLDKPPIDCHCSRCSNPENTFLCEGCGRYTSYCNGGDGDELCNDCWSDRPQSNTECTQRNEANDAEPKGIELEFINRNLEMSFQGMATEPPSKQSLKLVFMTTLIKMPEIEKFESVIGETRTDLGLLITKITFKDDQARFYLANKLTENPEKYDLNQLESWQEIIEEHYLKVMSCIENKQE